MLRRLDHAGIFLMIAGSYTPFTIHNLHGAWAWGMTAAVWSIAGIGALAVGNIKYKTESGLFQRMTHGSMMQEVWPWGTSNTAPST